MLPNTRTNRRGLKPSVSDDLKGLAFGCAVLLTLFVAALTSLVPQAIYAAVGTAALFVVLVPWYTQKLNVSTSPWAMVTLSILLGATCTGYCLTLKWPDKEHIEAFFLMGQEPGYFLYPSLVFVIGVVSLTAGYASVRGEPLTGFVGRRQAPWRPARIYLVSMVLLAISLWATREWVRQTGGLSLHSISSKRTLIKDLQVGVNQHGPLLELAKLGEFGFLIFLGFTVYSRRGLTFLRCLMLSSLFVGAVAVPFMGSRRQPIMWLFLCSIVLIQHSPRKLRLPQLGLAMACALVVFQLLSIIRGQDTATVSLAEKSGIGDLVRSVVLNMNMADLSKTSHIINSVEEDLPLKYGTTFTRWLIAPIPRSVWPEKPLVQEYCLEVGHDIYGMRTSGIPPGLIAEGYWNYRVVGVVLMGLCFGAILKLSYDCIGIGRCITLPALLLHVVGPFRMGFDALGHSMGYGFFVSALNMAVMALLLRFITPESYYSAQPNGVIQHRSLNRPGLGSAAGTRSRPARRASRGVAVNN